MIAKAFKAIVALVILIALAVGGFLFYRSQNASAVDTWIGKQLVGIVSWTDILRVSFGDAFHTDERTVDATLASVSGRGFFTGTPAYASPEQAEDEPLDTPAQRWGVATAHDRVLLSGAGARRPSSPAVGWLSRSNRSR